MKNVVIAILTAYQIFHRQLFNPIIEEGVILRDMVYLRKDTRNNYILFGKVSYNRF